MKPRAMNLTKSKLFSSLLLLNMLFVAVSCRKGGPEDPGLEYMPDMYRSPSYKTYAPNALFADSSSARLPVAGTMPRNYTFFTYPSSNEGYEAAGRDLKNPFEANEVNLAEGKRLYTNFCMHCHGATGNGDGSVNRNRKISSSAILCLPVFHHAVVTCVILPTEKFIIQSLMELILMGSHASQVNPA